MVVWACIGNLGLKFSRVSRDLEFQLSVLFSKVLWLQFSDDELQSLRVELLLETQYRHVTAFKTLGDRPAQRNPHRIWTSTL